MGEWPARATLTFPANPTTRQQIRRALHRRAADGLLSPDATEELVVAVSEAVDNALRHTLTPAIELTWMARPDRVEVEVHDLGVFDANLSMASTGPPAGVGFRLMAALCDELTFRAGTAEHPGTSVRFVKYVTGRGTRPSDRPEHREE